ncbi:MAG: GAF domain-containing protein [Chloroflexi bacterium]|nr:GAF domain-containing protein [Chloroflexota bacterium]
MENNYHDPRISQYVAAAEQLIHGRFTIEVPLAPPDEVGQLGQALLQLSEKLEHRYHEFEQLVQLTSQVNAGLLLDEVLDNVYRNFRSVIPYNRIGVSLLTDDGQTVRARWARTDQPEMRLKSGFQAPLQGSSLQRILETGQPRILNDLVAYLAEHPQSNSTRRVVAEGMRSSLTCPLIANGIPIGFMFFSSIHPHTYAEAHVELFQQVAGQLAVIVEKGRLVSELAVQKQAIETRNAELKALNDLKNEFLGIAAHDLRNPLNVIYGTAAFLVHSNFNINADRGQELLREVCKQTEYMLDLINNLLDVSVIEAGKLKLSRTRLSLADFLAEISRINHTLAAAKQTQVVAENIAEVEVWADARRLRQVLDNLIGNAVKFSPPGSTVVVTAELRDAATVIIRVRDQGPGLTQEDQRRLFKNFEPLSARPTADEKSTGLGLAITRRMVEAHGGQISVESQPGQGATFWFTLPLAPKPDATSTALAHGVLNDHI